MITLPKFNAVSRDTGFRDLAPVDRVLADDRPRDRWQDEYERWQEEQQAFRPVPRTRPD